MALQAAKDTTRIRRRLKEIELQPALSTQTISVKLLVDGVEAHCLPPIKKRQPLRWGSLSLPCDVHPSSTVTVKITEKHTLQDRVELATFSISEVATQNTLLIESDNKTFTAKLIFLDEETARRAYSEALLKVQQMEKQQGVLEKSGKVGVAFKSLLSLGSVMADLDPTGGAPAVFAACTKAIEHLEQQEEQDASLNELIESLARMTPSVESVKKLADASLGETVTDMLNLIEDASLFFVNYSSRSPWTRALYSVLDSTPQERIQTFIAKSRKLGKEFNTRISVQNFGTIQMEHGTTAKLKDLKPVELAGYDPTRACIPGTRVEILNNVTAWTLEPDTNQRLSWVHGLAGLGKSSIAASLCKRLDEQHVLAASFFCKRDNPELRDPRRVLTNIVYGLALRWNPYGEAVAMAIRTDPELQTRHIQPLYDVLVAKPLQSIPEEKRPTSTLVVVVDALDECGDTDARKQLLICLRSMSQTASWLKLVVTSRPDADIQEFFGQTGTKWFAEYNVLNYDSLDDIRIFLKDNLADIIKAPGWPQDAVDRLAHRSSGLFIWAKTACKFLSAGLNPCKRLKQVLAGTHLTSSSAQLDALYTTAIRAAALDGGEDNLSDILEFLGIIIVTATRTPLSAVDLEKILRGRISVYVLNRAARVLSAVLYLDHQQANTIRVSHPSFMDYITEPSRSKELCVDLDQQNTILAKCCLETLIQELKFNMCKLETSHLLNSEIPDLQTQVQGTIAPYLSYSCLYWSSHLVAAQQNMVRELLRGFIFERQLLYWIEALSLLGKLKVAPSSLLELSRILSEDMKDCSAYAYDAYRFVLAFYDAISKSTPHLYLSALAFAPEGSEVAQRMRPLFPNMLAIEEGGTKEWTPCLFSIWVSGGVACVAISPDGRRIVSGSNDNMVRVWDAETGDLVLKPLQGHSSYVQHAAFSANGRRIISGSSDKTVRVWDAETGDSLFESPQVYTGRLRTIEASPNGQRIVSGCDDNSVRVSDIETGSLMFEPLQGHTDHVLSVVFSPDGRRIASGSSDYTVRVWDAETGISLLEPLEGHSSFVDFVTFSPNGRRIASGSWDKTIRVWDAETGKLLIKPLEGHSGYVGSVTFSPNGQHIASGSEDTTIRVWDVETGDPLFKPLQGHSGPVLSTTFSPDGRYIISGSEDGTVRVWDIETSKSMSEPLNGDSAFADPVAPSSENQCAEVKSITKYLQGHTDSVTSVAFSPDGRRIISGANDCTVRVWDAETGEPMLEPLEGHCHFVRSVAFSSDGCCFASGSYDASVRIWDTETGSSIVGPLEGHSGFVRSIAFSPDGRRIASGSFDQTVRVWDTRTGDLLLGPLQGHTDGVESVIFSPDGRRIVSGSLDKTVRVWDAETGDPLLEPLQGHTDEVNAVAMSPDGRKIVSGSMDYTVRVWDAEAGGLLLKSLEGHQNSVESVSYSPNGQCIASSACDNTVRIWDAETGDLWFEPLQGHSDWVYSVVFSLDGRRIVSGSRDNSVRIWDLEAYVAICSSAQRYMAGTRIALFPALKGGSERVSTSSQLASNTNSNGWVVMADGALLLWLPPEFRGPDHSSICISLSPSRRQMILDFSKFLHGTSWSSIGCT